MKSLSELQGQVRIYSSDSTYIITNDNNPKVQGLSVANRVYRKLCNLEQWPELTRIDSSISTAIGTSSYNFPSTPKFTNNVVTEMSNTSGEYDIVPKVDSHLDWNYFAKKTDAFPSVYKLQSIGDQYTIYFAPTPIAVSTVRITGVIEPTEFSSGDSMTIFYSSILDDALEYLIASELLFTDGAEKEAASLIQKAASIVTRYVGREITPDEIDPKAKEAT